PTHVARVRPKAAPGDPRIQSPGCASLTRATARPDRPPTHVARVRPKAAPGDRRTQKPRGRFAYPGYPPARPATGPRSPGKANGRTRGPTHPKPRVRFAYPGYRPADRPPTNVARVRPKAAPGNRRIQSPRLRFAYPGY